MNNYKIKVNNEVQSKEAQELFFALGAHWGQSKTTSFNPDPMSFIYFNGSSIYYGHDDENDEDWFLSGSSGKELTMPELRDLVVLHRKPTEQGLISGADALRALADGKEVDFLHDSHGWVSALGLNIEQVIGGLFKLRIKPRTIKLSLEIPAPFEPKAGDMVWCLDGNTLNGYKRVVFDDFDFGIGFWRTEEEIKQVVAALRGGIKG